MLSITTIPLVLLAAASSFTSINAQADNPDTPSGAIGGEAANSVWAGTGSQSVIWVSCVVALTPPSVLSFSSSRPYKHVHVSEVRSCCYGTGTETSDSGAET